MATVVGGGRSGVDHRDGAVLHRVRRDVLPIAATAVPVAASLMVISPLDFLRVNAAGSPSSTVTDDLMISSLSSW
ncbi:hypothetical protein [Amycolatopsis sp.]|uniref:hypothetical protein n=1 Tax=Amycolatopsis sp. TaxID=37632 RepID=UPI002CB8BB6E|nr:hypothetical protein [Amycolatopsis sp.]HVV11995.1 hypothetical protein [Amycolatopsis sp.]